MLANQIKALHNPVKEDKHCFSLEEEKLSLLNEFGFKFTSGMKANWKSQVIGRVCGVYTTGSKKSDIWSFFKWGKMHFKF